MYCDEVGGCFAGASPADLRGGTGIALGVHRCDLIISIDRLFLPGRFSLSFLRFSKGDPERCQSLWKGTKMFRSNLCPKRA